MGWVFPIPTRHKDLGVAPFTISELVAILISTLHDDEVGDVILVIEGLDNSSANAQSQFQYFLSILESLQTKKVKVCLSCHTTQIKSLKPIIYFDPLPEEKPILGESENPSSVLCACYQTQEAIDVARQDADMVISNLRAIRLRSHFSLAIARQILKRLSSKHDIAAFTMYLKQQCLDAKYSESREIDNLYEWALSHLMNTASREQVGLLFLIAAAARSLTSSEVSKLAPLAEKLAHQYQSATEHAPTTPTDQTTLLSDIDAAPVLLAVEDRLLGLLRIAHNTLAIFHPTFRTFLLEKLNRNNLLFYCHYHIGMSCLELMQDLRGMNEVSSYNQQNRTRVSVGNFSYYLRHWSDHIQAAHSSDEWKSSHSVEALSSLTKLWEDDITRGLITQFSQVTLPPKADIPLPCLLVSCDLFKVLNTYYGKPEQESKARDKYLTIEERCAAVNLRHNALEILEKHSRVNRLNDQYGKSLSSYESWGRSREFGEESLPRPLIESIMADTTEGAFWDVFKEALKNDPGWLERSQLNGYLDQLLLLAIRRCDEEVVTMLLNKGANRDYIDQDDPYKPSVLHIAAGLGDAAVVRELVYRVARMTITDAFGMQPIHWAAERGHHRVVNLLVSPLVDSDKVFGRTPLFMACESASKLTVRVLLKFGLSTNFPDSRQQRPIHVASAAGSTDIVRLLMLEGANPQPQDEQHITPLHLAAFGGWTGVVDELLFTGIPADPVTTDLETPLHFACKSPNPSLAVVLALLQRQSNPQAPDSKGVTPFHIAVRSGSIALVELLLKSTPYPHHIDELVVLAGSRQDIIQALLRSQKDRPSEVQSPVNQLHLPDENALVNVVFVHGYLPSSKNTWSHESFQFAWPEKYLPESEARAHVFFWSHQIELTDFSSLNNVHELGKSLLDYVAAKVYSGRSDSPSELRSKPLVFVGHSLGGLVIKAAITQATDEGVLANTKGVVFLGTPHKGVDLESLNEVVSKLVKQAVYNRFDDGQDGLSYGRIDHHSCPGDIRTTQRWKGADDYNKLEAQFIDICWNRRIRVLAFAEETSQIIPLNCASYPFSIALNIRVNKKHQGLGRVDGPDDIIYKEILRFLLTVIAQWSKNGHGSHHISLHACEDGRRDSHRSKSRTRSHDSD
ncbi:hypothetical protein F5Y14DRAFT_464353 [Nemania sp. NC0429]|nr:hypothetical protein F5Y14DRAFT_464353 [Nemania sp. NC0429]